ncbi:MAG: GNAT family N-acetyltransferase [Anaerolineae bacterium]|nr:GNAT family N-acetyltransferase [Anaerolineae bacterium]
MKRYKYTLDLHKVAHVETTVPDHLTIRTPTATDTAVLADLMMDAYPGSIDFDGTETWDDAWHEVDGFFQGRSGMPLLGCSRLVLAGDKIVSACLVGMWDERQRPLLYYIMTAADWKGQGLAGVALDQALQATAAAGYDEILAIITADNMPSEKLCMKAGFKRIDE